MVKHFFISAVRNLFSNKVDSIICIVGLALGMGAFAILISYVSFETSYDRFHSGADRIYRVESTFEKNGAVVNHWASSSFGYAPAMKAEMPEVEDVVRISYYDAERILKYKDRVFRERNVVYADSNFFNFFSYPLIEGDKAHVLTEPNTIVLSEKACLKYFPGENPLGKTIAIKTQKTAFECVVTGVFKDFPKQSNLQLDFLVSYMTAPAWEREFWYMHEAYTYVKVRTPADAVKIEKKFPLMAEKYKTADAMKDHEWGVRLIPLKDIHLNASKPYEMEAKGDRESTYYLMVIAVVILLISWLNVINLIISKTMERAGEISVRKMTGATFASVMAQMFVEAFVFNVAAAFVYIATVFSSVPFLKVLLDPAVLEAMLGGSYIWLVFLAALVAGVIVTGLIPVLTLRKIKIGDVLKNRLSYSNGFGKKFRHGMIILQYSIAIGLVIATMAINDQIDFMQSHGAGVTVSNKLVVRTPAMLPDYEAKMEAFMQEISATPGVTGVALSSSIPGRMPGYAMANNRSGNTGEVDALYDMVRVSHDFISLYDLDIIAGRSFSRDFQSDRESALVLTESSCKLFGFESPQTAVGQTVHLEGHDKQQFNVIGVAKDYNHMSLREAYRPIIFTVYNPFNWIDLQYITIASEHVSVDLISKAKAKYETLFPDTSFDYFFLDEFYHTQYKTEYEFRDLTIAFTITAIAIICLGVFGISRLMLIRMEKEIGIRLINGAESKHIFMLVLRQFVYWLMIAFIIAIPIAWYAVESWLESFSNRIVLSGWIFVAGGLAILSVTFALVIAQSYRTAMSNPIRLISRN